MSGDEGGTVGPLAQLYALQRDPRRRLVAAAVAAVIGLGLGSVHWLGLVVGGALVGWSFPTVGRALAAGLAFAVLTLLAWAARLAMVGGLGTALETWPIVGLTVAMAFALGPLGAITRAIGPQPPD
jgi:DNA-binding transcriptional LysR family regulator